MLLDVITLYGSYLLNDVQFLLKRQSSCFFSAFFLSIFRIYHPLFSTLERYSADAYAKENVITLIVSFQMTQNGHGLRLIPLIRLRNTCKQFLLTESGCLRAGKLETVTYIFPPWHRKNAASKQASNFFTPHRPSFHRNKKKQEQMMAFL